MCCKRTYHLPSISIPQSLGILRKYSNVSVQKVSVNGVDQGQLKGVRAPDSDYVCFLLHSTQTYILGDQHFKYAITYKLLI